MPMIFTAVPSVIRPGAAPSFHGMSSDYFGYRSSSFPPGSPYPQAKLASGYFGFRSPSFPPASPMPPPGARLVFNPTKALAGMGAAFTRTAYNQPPYFQGMGEVVPGNGHFQGMGDMQSVIDSATTWISANPLMAAGGALAIGALVFGGKRRR